MDNAQQHQSRPLVTLKDPNAFGPPPKNVNYHGGAAVPNAITPDTRGLGAPIDVADVRAKEQADREAYAAREAEEDLPPPGPYKADTTGLSTRNLPKPPIRQLDQDNDFNLNGPKKPKPSLPPRLPPRQNSGPPNGVSPPPSYDAATSQAPPSKNLLNQNAINRLGSAGVSVPGFGISGDSQSTSPWRDQQGPGSDTTQPNHLSRPTVGMNELQGRFSKMSTSTPPESPSGGTTFAQKQSALRTMNSFKNDPSSVSLSDAKAAASTANNFRERHGEQVSTGMQGMNNLNNKYGISNKLNGYASGGPASSLQGAPSTPVTPIGQPSIATETKTKAPPPPPPPKKRMNDIRPAAPPEIPLASKPRP